METLNSFWLRFVNNSLTSLDAIIEAIRQCITNLCGETHKCSKELENTIKLTDLRLEKYEKLHDVLKDYGVHYPDDEIILDAFDFNINHCPNLDFITFDEDLYKAVSSIDTFSFKHVKGRFDYL